MRLLCISVNLPYAHAWNTVVTSGLVPSCYLVLLDKLQKRICSTVGPSLAASLEPLAHDQNVTSLSFFYRYHFVLADVLQNWSNMFCFLFLVGGSRK